MTQWRWVWWVGRMGVGGWMVWPSKMVPLLWQSRTYPHISFRKSEPWAENQAPQGTWWLCRFDPRWSSPWPTDTHYFIPCQKCQKLLRNFPSAPPSSSGMQCQLSGDVSVRLKLKAVKLQNNMIFKFLYRSSTVEKHCAYQHWSLKQGNLISFNTLRRVRWEMRHLSQKDSLPVPSNRSWIQWKVAAQLDTEN